MADVSPIVRLILYTIRTAKSIDDVEGLVMSMCDESDIAAVESVLERHAKDAAEA